MDKIRAEIERKKQLLAKVSSQMEPSQKFITQRDLQAVAENEKFASLEALEQERENRKRKNESLANNTSTNHHSHGTNNNGVALSSKVATTTSSLPVTENSQQQQPHQPPFSSSSSGSQSNWNSLAESVSQMSLLDIQLRLRQFLQPITLFGESNEERKHRLTSILLNQQHIEEQDDFRSRRNEFVDGGDGDDDDESDEESDDDESDDEEKEKANNSKENGDVENPSKRATTEKSKSSESKKKVNCDRTTGKSQFSKDSSLSKEKVIVKYFKFILKMWEWDLNERDGASKLSMKGKNETKTQKQCKDYIRPLFKQCKKKILNPDILYAVYEMVKCCEEGDFMKANDHYLRCAIGNSAWPIGLTMVGIHERSGREKISSSKVAHIMNNEMQRKYLSSVKRLMTFAQTKRPDVPPSKKVLV